MVTVEASLPLLEDRLDVALLRERGHARFGRAGFEAAGGIDRLPLYLRETRPGHWPAVAKAR